MMLKSEGVYYLECEMREEKKAFFFFYLLNE